MTALPLIRRRILIALGAPASTMLLLTAVSDFMEALGSDKARIGLDVLSELTGRSPKFAQRAIVELQQWEARLNIQTCTVQRGQRNVRRVTEFHDNRLIEAGLWISQQLASDPRSLHTVAKIDAYCETAIPQYLRKPLKEAPTKRTPRPKPPKRTNTTAGGSVTLSDKTDTLLSTAGLTLLRQGFWPFPVDVERKRPYVTRWQQQHSEHTVAEWSKRHTTWGIACGTELPTGGFLAVLDKDRHGPTFGDGFKTVTLRTKDLGPLPETFTITTPSNGEHDYFRTIKPLPTTHDELGPGLDLKGAGGFVLTASCPGYEVVRDLPIAQLPAAWEQAFAVVRQPKRKVSVGQRHDYLRDVAYAMACRGKSEAEIMRTLGQRLAFNCESGGRAISTEELQALVVSAIEKILRADRMLEVITA